MGNLLVKALAGSLALGLAASTTAASPSFSWSWLDVSALRPDTRSPTLPISLRLLEEALVAGESVFLNELVRCEGDAAACDEAAGIKLFASPLPGTQVFVEREQLATILRAEWPGRVWAWRGPERLRMRAALLSISQDEVRRAFAATLTVSGLDPRVQPRLDKLQLLARVRLRPGEYRIVFPDWEEDAPRGYEWVLAHYKGQRKFRVRFEREEGEQQPAAEISALVRLHLEAQLQTAKKNLGAQKILLAEDFTQDWRPITHSLEHYVLSTAELVGLALKQSLAAGQALEGRFLMRPWAVARGQKLQLEIQTPGMVVAGAVRALGPGRIGETIDVVYEATQQRIKATILSSSAVALAIPSSAGSAPEIKPDSSANERS